MGVTINSKNCSIDLGYGGFNNLRTKVAELTGKEIYEHYNKLNDSHVMILYGKERKMYFDEYNKQICEIEEKYSVPSGILIFLYLPDCDGEVNSEICKQIFEVIKDYDDCICYGYAGRSDCTMFRDFKELVKDCVNNNCNMEWY